MQIFLFTRFEVENVKCRQWLQNNWLFARIIAGAGFDGGEQTNPYVQFSAFSNDWLNLICLNDGWTSY